MTTPSPEARDGKSGPKDTEISVDDQGIAVAANLDIRSLLMLLGLHLSSAWGDRSISFAVYLFLVVVFPSTLVPASIYGFVTTGSGILFSSNVGHLIDKHNRLFVVRLATAIQKISMGVIYAMFLLYFLTALGSHLEFKGRAIAAFVGMVLCGCLLKVSTICLNLSIERDWATTIGQGSPERLTTLNTWLRRTDLTCDLVAPTFVSGLSAGVSYSFATGFLAGMTAVSFFLEMVLCGITYRRFPELAIKESVPLQQPHSVPNSRPESTAQKFLNWIAPKEVVHDFVEFCKMPVFFTSLSIASIYLTVLSFDGTMLTFLKNARDYSDPFLAGQRAACTVGGLLGTLLFPLISRRLGLVRTGSWSIWFEFSCLVPVVISLFHGVSVESSGHAKVPAWNAVFLFGGMALSRIGLWMFDLAQLQILQESLDTHPRRNRLTSFQYAFQNVFDMAKYALTMGLARPSEFRWAALTSVIMVFTGGSLYVFGYARRVRGHIAPHWRWLEKFKVI